MPMPLNRLLFLLFLVVLCGALLFLLYGPGERSTKPVTLTPKAYIEKVEQERQTDAPPQSDSAESPARP
jgi:hypothetical protein